MRVVIDTNVMISGIFWKGKPYKILEHWINNHIEVIASKDILDEYMRVLQIIGERYNWTDVADRWNEFIFQNLQLVEVSQVFMGCRDWTDNKFVDCAIAGHADIIVSGDTDLLVLKKVKQIKIITVDQAINSIVR